MIKILKKKIILVLERLSLQKYLKDELAKPLFYNTEKKYSYVKKFLNLKSKKKFFIIRRTPGAGMFSNVTFVLNKIRFAKKYNLIPVIDMYNFTTIYNEKNTILSSKNSWEYYFTKLNKYSLEHVYKWKVLYL